MKLHTMIRKYYEQAGGDGAGGGGGAGGGDAGDGGDSGAGGDSGTGGGGGGGELDWRSAIPEEYRSEKSLAPEQVKDLSGLIGQFVNAQKVIGQSIRIPGDNASDEDKAKFYERITAVDGVARIPGAAASDEEKAAFWSKLGVPANADEYETFDPTTLEIPEGMKIDNSMAESLKPVAHNLGMTKDQVKGLTEWYAKESLARATEAMEKKQESINALKREYGQDYQLKVDAARAVIEKIGSPELLSELDEQIGNMPGMIKVFADLAPAVLGDGYFREQGGQKTTMTRSEIDAELTSLMGEPGYDDRRHPDHQKLMLRTQKLNEMLTALDNV